MNDKNNVKKGAAMRKEDIQLYRLFAIFGAAFLGFAGLRLVNEAKLIDFLKIGKWFAVVLLLLSIAYPIYVRLIKKTDESGRVFTSVGISYFLTPAFFMLATYSVFHNANVKFQVAYAAISLFAVIYVTFREEFRCISALCFACAAFLYYMSAKTYNGFEAVLSLLSKVLIFAVPAVMLLLAILALTPKNGAVKLGGKEVYRLSSKFVGVLFVILCLFFLAAGALLLVYSALFVYLMIALLLLYIAIGIVCTIRLI